jgi:hydrogenase expression/formation protein HypE
MNNKFRGGEKKLAENRFYPPGKLPMEELSRLISRYTRKDPRIIVYPGIGKDATVFSFGDIYLIAKTDPITFATDEIGWYAVQVNANDVASMGGASRWFLATLLLPEKKTTSVMVEEIFAQISGACQELGVVLCGGHTEITYGLDRPIVVGQMLGEVAPEKLVVPDRIRKGDEILLTKGIAIEGTALIAREKKELSGIFGKEWVERCQKFLKDPGISVVRDAQIACQTGEVHAMHDPTEGGLATGLYELARTANVGMFVEKEKISIFPETDLLCKKLKLDPLGLIASGALLIVVPPKDSTRIIEALQEGGVPAWRIGKIWEEGKGVKMLARGNLQDLPLFPRDEVAKLFTGEVREG